MTAENKESIVQELVRLSQKESQAKIANRIEVSTATISHMINHKWELIRDEMWRKVKNSLNITFGWQTAMTQNFKLLNVYLEAAQTRGISIAISHEPGAGKTHTFENYKNKYHNVIYVVCKTHWTKKIYVKNLLKACGLEPYGTVEELITRFVDHVRKLEMPLIIIDQTDKLKDPSLDLFMDFYNDLDGHCGFVLSGVPAFKKRVERGCRADKIGYRELKSRIGRKFISLDPISFEDVKNICCANGVTQEGLIREIFNTCEGDLRRVKRSIDQHFLMNENKVA